MKLKHQLSALRERPEKWITFLDQGITSGSNFLIGILLARALGLSAYGEYSLIWILFLFCSNIHHSWIITPLYSIAPTLEQKEQAHYIKGLLLHQLVFSLIASLGLGAFLFLAGDSYVSSISTPLLFAAPFCLFCYLMFDFLRRFSYVFHQAPKALRMDILTYGTLISLLSVFIAQDVLTIELTFLIAGFSFFTALCLEGRTLFFRSFTRSEFNSFFQRHWSYSKWLLGTSVIQWTGGNFFLLVAASLLTPAAVGAIRILQNVVGVMHVLFLALENYVPVRAAKILKEGGHSALSHFLRGITLRGALITLVLGLLLAYFGEEILSLLYTDQYTDYAHLLYGFALLYVLVYIGTNYRFAIRTLHETRSIFIAYLLGALFSLIFAKPIILHFEIKGILIGLIVTQVIMQAYFIFSLKNKVNLLWK